jgi:hypothetical protein
LEHIENSLIYINQAEPLTIQTDLLEQQWYRQIY